MINDKLQIVLITYNRKDYLKNTLDSILSANSPVKDLDITILDNHSTDGTSEMLEEYASKYKNITHVVNKINIGGNANCAKAFSEYLNKDYIWVLADNDKYNFECWGEIIYAINNDYDVIMTRKCNNNISELFYKANLISSCIYKTKNITSAVVENIYDNIRYLFPHLAIMAKNLNDNNKIYIPSKDIVILGINPGYKTTLIRGREENEIPETRKKMFWSVGFFNSIELIKDRKKQIEIIENLRHYHKSLFSLFKSIMIYNKTIADNYFYNLAQIFRVLSFKQKLKFILAYLVINLSIKNYKYWFIRYKDEWIEYLEQINEQKYINKLSKKFKNKKILLYGAGLFFDILSDNYDLSKLNIIGISDKKFEAYNDKFYKNIPIVKPSEIKNSEIDVILFTLKEYNKIEKFLRNSNICNSKMLSLIRNDFKYPIKNN